MKLIPVLFLSLFFASVVASATWQDVNGMPAMQVIGQESTVRDTTYLRLLNEKSVRFLESNQPDSARLLIDEALHLSDILADIEGEAGAVNNLAHFYLNKGMPDSVVSLLNDTIIRYEGTVKEIELGNSLASAHNMLGNFSRGLEIYLQTRYLAELRGDDRMVIGITQNIGNSYNALGDVTAAIDSYLTSLEMAEAINDTLIISVVLDNLGSINVEDGNYELAEEYLFRALEMNIQIGHKRNQITNYMSLGGLFRATERFAEAQESYDRVLELSENLNHILSGIQARYNLGLLKTEMKEFDRAMELFEESLSLSIEHNILIGSFFNQSGIAGVYAETGNYARAVELNELALEIAESVNAVDLIRGTLQNLHETTAATGDSAMAYRYLLRYNQLSDSLSQTAREEALARQQILLGLRSERERSELLQETINAQRINSIISLVLLGVIAAALFTTIMLLQKKRKSNTLLKKQSEELRDVNNMKDRLLSVLAHDLRTPISNIKGVLYMIREKVLNNEDVEKIIADIDFQLEQDIHTLTNYLQWAQTQRDGIKAEREPISVSDQLQHVVSSFRNAAENKGIFLKTITDKEMKVMGDNQMLTVIIRNLLTNAVNYVEPGGQILVRSVQRDDTILITVEDNGKGIPENLQPTLFEPFSIPKGNRNGYKLGAGLGLSICKDFALKMGGDLTFISSPQTGTTFTLSLHRYQKSEVADNVQA